jgi:hypothetical protein
MLVMPCLHVKDMAASQNAEGDRELVVLANLDQNAA